MLGLFLSLRYLLVKKQWSFFTTCAVMLAGAAGLPLLQARWLGALYPVSRAALYYLPLILLLMILVMDALLQIRHPVTAARFLPVIPVLAAGLVLWSFARSYDPHTLRDWGSEAHNRRILALIDQDRQADCPNCVIKLASSWLMEPSLNFYRTTLGLDWLVEVERDPVAGLTVNYYYGFEDDFQKMDHVAYIVLARFPDTKTVLARAAAQH